MATWPDYETVKCFCKSLTETSYIYINLIDKIIWSLIWMWEFWNNYIGPCLCLVSLSVWNGQVCFRVQGVHNSVLNVYSQGMAILYNAVFCFFAVVHLALGVSHLFKIPPYDPSLFYIDGNPGTGNTGVEKFMALILGSWYTSLTLALILAFFNK